MARKMNFWAINFVSFFAFVLISTLHSASASTDRTKIVEFDVKPGGVVHTFAESIVGKGEGRVQPEAKEFECSFTYASQGGTNERWRMIMSLSDDDRWFSCTVCRPQEKSYLFFTQFQAELKNAKIEYASAYGNMVVGQGDMALNPEEFTVGNSTVTHTEGRFRAELSKLTMIGWTPPREL